MSRVTQTVCDGCGEIIKKGESYYDVGDITLTTRGYDNAKQVLKRGDYCENCFRQIMKNELK